MYASPLKDVQWQHLLSVNAGRVGACGHINCKGIFKWSQTSHLIGSLVKAILNAQLRGLVPLYSKRLYTQKKVMIMSLKHPLLCYCL